MNLQLEHSKFQREFLTKFTPKNGAIMQGSTQALAKEFLSRRALRIDDEAPDFVLQNTDQELLDGTSPRIYPWNPKFKIQNLKSKID